MDVTAPQEVEAKLDGFTQLQIALKNTRRARRAWAWPRNQFWFESLLQGDFLKIGGKKKSGYQGVPIVL